MQATVLAKLSLNMGSRRTRRAVPVLAQELFRVGLTALPAVLPLLKLGSKGRPEAETSDAETSEASETAQFKKGPSRPPPLGKPPPSNPNPPNPWAHVVGTLLAALILEIMAEKA